MFLKKTFLCVAVLSFLSGSSFAEGTQDPQPLQKASLVTCAVERMGQVRRHFIAVIVGGSRALYEVSSQHLAQWKEAVSRKSTPAQSLETPKLNDAYQRHTAEARAAAMEFDRQLRRMGCLPELVEMIPEEHVYHPGPIHGDWWGLFLHAR